ncbi:CDP-diacylglycerol--serine O-phosphatidyltransferase [Mucilaginibacter terrenus]|uniref:CDP-diacylglycerol--serine O-phosphatidyltransferase n=1 Tax=Mucilaginibacter terrenus TaxID=2482727 RepID=A0A3E2NWY8_9SPHI|nr:CDP-diacylglycerol--serine O-phosphatidyltransferase [Mucilaginibacter terrenus]RFZ85534.1 CDP-diacylglycerol--serine O-phosphatidyltransferase [Mucilaginibacter terrenus]
MKRRVKKHLPNAITCANLFSGCVGIVFAFQDNLVIAAYAIFLAAIFDFFDGFASRVLNSQSCIGKDLDSLSDMVSFGVLPSAIVYELLLRAPQVPGFSEYFNYLAFLLAVFSMLRLAKFNTDTRQADSFIGLPTPANAILIASFPLILQQYEGFARYILNPYVLVCFIALMCTLLVAEIPLMSLKFKNSDFNKNFYRYLLLLFSAILILFFKFAAVPVVIVMYITLSLIQLKFANEGMMSSSHKQS